MIDLTAELFAQRSKPRGDELLPHVADLTSCLRATAYRRRGHNPEPFTPNKLAHFAVGNGYEMEVAETLRAAGHEVVQHLSIDLFGPDGLLGHPDLWVDREHLIECKTTDWSTPDPEPKPAHVIQASAYALALDAKRTTVLVKYGANFRNPDQSHVERAYEVEPEQFRDWIEEQAGRIIDLTDPAAPLPEAVPNPFNVNAKGENWECRYCAWRLCPEHPRHEEPELQ